ncbi:MAG: hypothetical protein RR382_00690 [Tannerellaceae bacterium]
MAKRHATQTTTPTGTQWNDAMEGIMKRIDMLLREVGLTRDDISYKYKKKGEVWFVPTFNPLWWVITIVAVIGATCWIGVLVIILVVLAG